MNLQNTVRYVLFIILVLSLSCKNKPKDMVVFSKEEIIRETDSILNTWHVAAAKADFEGYFNVMTSDAIFIGTDATENWDIIKFKEFSKPYFDKGQAWDFTPLERHIFVSEDGETVWFDELLDTWMGLCRGSGVLKNENGHRKIAHYVLSVTVPNDNVTSIVELKKDTDSILTKKLKLRTN